MRYKSEGSSLGNLVLAV